MIAPIAVGDAPADGGDGGPDDGDGGEDPATPAEPETSPEVGEREVAVGEEDPAATDTELLRLIDLVGSESRHAAGTDGPGSRRTRRRPVRPARWRPARRLPGGSARHRAARLPDAAALDERAGVPARSCGDRRSARPRSRRAALRPRAAGGGHRADADSRDGSRHVDRALLADRPPRTGADDRSRDEQRSAGRRLGGRGRGRGAWLVHRRTLPRPARGRTRHGLHRGGLRARQFGREPPPYTVLFNSDGAPQHPGLQIQTVGQNLLLASTLHAPGETVDLRAYLVGVDTEVSCTQPEGAEQLHRLTDVDHVPVGAAERNARQALPEFTEKRVSSFRVPEGATLLLCGRWFPGEGAPAWESAQATFESSVIVQTADRMLPKVELIGFEPRDDRTIDLSWRVHTAEGMLCGNLDWSTGQSLPSALCAPAAVAGGGADAEDGTRLMDRGFSGDLVLRVDANALVGGDLGDELSASRRGGRMRRGLHRATCPDLRGRDDRGHRHCSGVVGDRQAERRPHRLVRHAHRRPPGRLRRARCAAARRPRGLGVQRAAIPAVRQREHPAERGPAGGLALHDTPGHRGAWHELRRAEPARGGERHLCRRRHHHPAARRLPRRSATPGPSSSPTRPATSRSGTV